METNFSDKVFLITGASSGLGGATAIYLSRLSAKLSLVGRDEEHLSKIATFCEKLKGNRPVTIPADVTTDSERIINETIQHYGRIDVLVNNAAIMAVGGIKTSSIETFDSVMNTNLRAVFNITKEAIPHLISTKGCIINVSCLNSVKPNSTSLAYNLSKTALDHFTKCVALELAPDGVRVNSVSPGFMTTNLLRNAGLTEGAQEMVENNICNKTPLKTTVKVDEVASLISFLASDKAKSITGANYAIDAGASLLS